MKDRVGRYLVARRVRAVLPHVRGRLLDVGCGTNELVRSYAGWGVGADVHLWTGVDLVADASAGLPFSDGAFDTVAIVAALNHITPREAALAEARRVLRPKGRIVLTMIPPGISTTWHALRRRSDADQSERGMKPGEVYGLKAAEVRRLIEAAGFRILGEHLFMLGLNRVTLAERS